ncbi:MAG: hypothetical protein FJY83_08215 [Candidatus Aminicenantes bacterium]|nr:hypothetical protein [Candidatus Aminicenantes bacterium]
MTKNILSLCLSFLLLGAGTAQAKILRGLTFDFGGVTALGEVGSNLSPGFAGSLTVSGPSLGIPLELFLRASRQKKQETESTRLTLLPVFLSTRLELRSSASRAKTRPYLLFGLGGIFESATFPKEKMVNFDPGLLLGCGIKHAVGPKLSLVLGARYFFAYQTYQRGAELNGHFIQAGFGLDWRI